jgi:predicted permease
MAAFLRTILSRIAASFHAHRSDDEFEEETRAHLAMLVDRFTRLGMNPEEAEHAAKLQFGGVAQIKEGLRERRILPHLDALLRDAHYAFRQLRRAPAFTIAAILTLTVGIGANAAIFAVVNAVVFRPLPYPQADRLVSFQSIYSRGVPRPTNLSYPTFFDFRSNQSVFEHFVCYRDSQFVLSGSENALHVDGEIVSWDLFSLLRVQPELGRGFLPAEEKPGEHVVILSHELWQSQFGGDRNVMNRAITLNGGQYTVIGVAPPDFRFPPDNPSIQLWTTAAVDAVVSPQFQPLTAQRGARVLDVIARLKDEITVDQARAQMDSIAAALAKQYPDHNKNIATTYIVPALDRLIGNIRKPMLILLVAVFLVLLIACANIANLVLARSVEREREFALRAAIGASRQTVIWQILTESLMLALLGSLTGLAFAWASLRLMLPLAAKYIPRISQANLDARVLAFSIGLTVVTSILFSFAPALRIAKVDLVASLKEGTRSIATGVIGVRSLLVIGQITFGLVLLSGASFLIASFLYLERRDPGFDADDLLTFSLDLPAQYKTSQQIAFSDQLRENLRSLPGVRAVATGIPLPLTGNQMTVAFDIQARPSPPSERPHSNMAIVTPGFFSTMAIRLLQGRDFTERDDAASAPVLIVNQAFARRFFLGEEVIGKRIQPGAINGNSGPVMREIVGVVADAKQSALSAEFEPIYYFPYKQLSWTIGTIVLRTSVPPRTLEPAVRAMVASLDQRAPVYQVRTMDELSSLAIAPPRFLMLLLSSFAGVALLLTAVGLYGIMAYSVSNRTREIGIRIALGAARATVASMVLKQALRLVLVGVVAGAVGAIAVGYLMKPILFGVNPHSPLLLLLACFGMVLTGVISAYLPAQRAASVDPMQALRAE